MGAVARPGVYEPSVIAHTECPMPLISSMILQNHKKGFTEKFLLNVASQVSINTMNRLTLMMINPVFKFVETRPLRNVAGGYTSQSFPMDSSIEWRPCTSAIRRKVIRIDLFIIINLRQHWNKYLPSVIIHYLMGGHDRNKVN
jgi:hypothetical protein